MNSFTSSGAGSTPPCASRSRCTRPDEDVVQETYDYDAGSRHADAAPVEGGGGGLPLLPGARPRPDPAGGELLESVAELPDAAGSTHQPCSGPVGFATAWELVTTGRDGEHDKLVAAGVEARVAANVVRNEAAGVDDRRAGGAGEGDRGAGTASRATPISPRCGASANAGFKADTYLEQELRVRRRLARAARRPVLAAHADQVAAYRAGKEGLLGFFVGQVMKETGGGANPKLVGDMLASEAAGMSGDAVAEANALLLDRGYREPQLAVHVSPMPGRVLLKGSKIVSPFADSPDVVLRVVRDRVPAADELGDRHADADELAPAAE